MKQPSAPTKVRLGAGAAGAGGGTVLIAIANALPDDSVMKAMLFWSAPTATVISGTLVALLAIQAQEYFRERTLVARYEKARRAIEECLSNPKTSQAHKKGLVKQLENIEGIRVRSQLQALDMIAEAEFEKAFVASEGNEVPSPGDGSTSEEPAGVRDAG